MDTRAMRTTLIISFGLLAASTVTGCAASDFEQRKLKDGSYEFTCQLSMDECMRRVQDRCDHQRFRILEGTSETRLRDAPPFEKSYHTSRLRLQCTSDGADVLLSVDSGGAAAPKTSCSAGETRTCVGPGACKGGQSCLADGSGFSACDCGVSSAPPPSAAPPEAPAQPVTPPADSPQSPVSPAPPSPPVVPSTMPPAEPLSR
jgi:hypothetical protein